MAAMSDYLRTALLKHSLSLEAFTMPATLYVCAATQAVASSDTGSTIVEPTYTGYARVELADSDFDTVALGAGSNATDWIFPDVQAGGDTVTSIVICDAASGGNMLWYDNLASSVALSTTQTPLKIDAGQATFGLS